MYQVLAGLNIILFSTGENIPILLYQILADPNIILFSTGENCHRGAALGALLGAAAVGQGKTIPQKLIDGLNIRPAVIKLLHQNNSL